MSKVSIISRQYHDALTSSREDYTRLYQENSEATLNFYQEFLRIRFVLSSNFHLQIDFSQPDLSGQSSGKRWIAHLLDLLSETAEDDIRSSDVHPGTVDGIKRGLGFLQIGNNRIFRRFNPNMGDVYQSVLPDLIMALESGRVVIVDTILISEFEQFMFTTITIRVLFALRKAHRSCDSVQAIEQEICIALGNDL